MTSSSLPVRQLRLIAVSVICVLALVIITCHFIQPSLVRGFAPPLRIHQIQGSGLISPYIGQLISTTGIVTGRKSNGFFIQTPDNERDNDPNTSEGIFVFTSSMPPATTDVGNLVNVTGTVTEFIPSSDQFSPPLTEISSSPIISIISTGNVLPAPITLTTADTLPSGDLEQLEKFEGMRVQVNSLTVISPTQGSVSEMNATGNSNGIFYGVITGVARPFREPGVKVPDALPAEAPCCVPRFDANPERLQVNSGVLTGAQKLEVTSGAIVTNLVGPLDYSLRTYTILPDPLIPPTVTGNLSAIPVSVPRENEFTIASFNAERFFDTVNDPNISDIALTVTAFNNRLNKVSLAIRNVMRTPDIIGMQEVENLSTLQAIANKVNSDAVAAGESNPNYQAFLEEGNDIGGIDVGFLVKTGGGRVTMIEVLQEGKNTTYINPNNNQPAILNDRPPLILRAVAHHQARSISFPITVIVNHLLSLSGTDDPTTSKRTRTKRRAQAEFLASLIQARQIANPIEHIISIGDYNAFQFNDGLVDVMGTVKGIPTPTDQVLFASSDLVNPDMIDLIDLAPTGERYSFVFEGNAQELDHAVVTNNLLRYVSRLNYARNNADFPETYRNDPTRPERISDHDVLVAYLNFQTVLPFRIPPRPTSKDRIRVKRHE